MEDPRATLYARYSSRLRGALARYGLRHDEIDDAVQETFTRLYDALQHEQVHAATLAGYLFTLARNIAVDMQREAARVSQLGAAAAEIVASSRPAAVVEARDLWARVLAVVAELPEDQRAPFLLRERDGLSYREIAQRLQITANTVGTRLFQARQFLRKRFADSAGPAC